MPNVPWTSIYPDGPGSAGAVGLAGAETTADNPLYPGMPAGAAPVHRDVTIAAASTTALWSPAPGRKFVLVSAFISSDAAMRIALVDDTDTQGNRPVDQYVAANGGSSPNLIPVPYVSKGTGNSLRVVTSAAGNVKVRVSGWEVDA